MNFGSNKTTPQLFPQNSVAKPPTPAPTVKLDPMLLELLRNVKEKKVGKSHSMKISD